MSLLSAFTFSHKLAIFHLRYQHGAVTSSTDSLPTLSREIRRILAGRQQATVHGTFLSAVIPVKTGIQVASYPKTPSSAGVTSFLFSSNRGVFTVSDGNNNHSTLWTVKLNLAASRCREY